MANTTQKYDLHVWWSIYVQAKDLGKAKREHFPAIVSVLGEPAVPFQYFKEDGGSFRLVAYFNFTETDMRTAVFETLETAYALADGWKVFGLGCLGTGKYRHVVGLWSAQKPLSSAPNLVSMMFEIERGLAKHMDEDGGVLISEFDPDDELEDGAESPFRV